MEYGIRPLREDEIPLLADFLYEAIFQRDGADPIPRSVLERPDVRVFIEDFGKEDDYCLVADAGGEVVGAVWARILAGPVKGFGNVDPHTPEFAISLRKAHRGRGIGRALMERMLALLREKGYARASLAVQKDNYAVALYESVGFAKVGENEEEYIMVCPL